MLSTVALLIASAIFGAPLRTAGVVDILLEKIIYSFYNKSLRCLLQFVRKGGKAVHLFLLSNHQGYLKLYLRFIVQSRFPYFRKYSFGTLI